MNTKTETMESLNDNLASRCNGDHSGLKSAVGIVLALWLGLVLYLGAQGAFGGAPGRPPLPLFLGFATPLAVFCATWFGSSAFRNFALSADLRLLSAIQGWRWAGMGFLSLYAHRILPALFVFPAAFGDMAIGVTAPWIVLRLIRQPSYAANSGFVTWNVLGIADLVIAVTIGALSSGIIPGLTGNITTGAMTQLPLILIPAFLVPIFIMLHVTAITQARRLAA